MKERPILFSGPMVRAILEGKKSQTRRVVKGLALEWLQPGMFSPEYVALPENYLCPYGVPGDRLWVRETWCDAPNPWGKPVLYRADFSGTGGAEMRATFDDAGLPFPARWRPSIFMPRQASRLTLEITAVRVERLHDIWLDHRYEPNPWVDLFAEGIAQEATWDGPGHPLPTPLSLLIETWDNINAKRGYPWASNPWVWALTFEVAR